MTFASKVRTHALPLHARAQTHPPPHTYIRIHINLSFATKSELIEFLTEHDVKVTIEL